MNCDDFLKINNPKNPITNEYDYGGSIDLLCRYDFFYDDEEDDINFLNNFLEDNFNEDFIESLLIYNHHINDYSINLKLFDELLQTYTNKYFLLPESNIGPFGSICRKLIVRLEKDLTNKHFDNIVDLLILQFLHCKEDVFLYDKVDSSKKIITSHQKRRSIVDIHLYVLSHIEEKSKYSILDTYYSLLRMLKQRWIVTFRCNDIQKRVYFPRVSIYQDVSNPYSFSNDYYLPDELGVCFGHYVKKNEISTNNYYSTNGFKVTKYNLNRILY